MLPGCQDRSFGVGRAKYIGNRQAKRAAYVNRYTEANSVIEKNIPIARFAPGDRAHFGFCGERPATRNRFASGARKTKRGAGRSERTPFRSRPAGRFAVCEILRLLPWEGCDGRR